MKAGSRRSRHIKRPIRTVMFHFFFRVFGIELTISMGLEMAFTLGCYYFDGGGTEQTQLIVLSLRTLAAALLLKASTMRQSSRSSLSQRSFYGVSVLSKNACKQIFWWWWLVNIVNDNMVLLVVLWTLLLTNNMVVQTIDNNHGAAAAAYLHWQKQGEQHRLS